VLEPDIGAELAMSVPIPEFLRGYGETLGPDERRIFLVFVALVVLVTLVVAWYAIGALVQGVVKWSKRRRGASLEPRSPSERPKKKSDTDG